MAKLPAFLTHLDRKALRAVLVVSGMFLIVIAILVFGKSTMDLDDGVYLRWFEAFASSPWSLLIVIATYVFAAFLGVPQWMLIAGTVFGFGPVAGSIYAWVSTLISATINFWIGRKVGAERIREFGGELVNRIIRVVRKNGFITSLAVRLVPTGPFVIVNMAAGVSHMTFWAFIGGTALGIIPKILIVAFLGQGVLSGVEGKLYMLGFLLLALIFMGLMLIARKRLSPLVTVESENAKKQPNSHN